MTSSPRFSEARRRRSDGLPVLLDRCVPLNQRIHAALLDRPLTPSIRLKATNSSATIPSNPSKTTSNCSSSIFRCQRPKTTRRRLPLDPRGIPRCSRDSTHLFEKKSYSLLEEQSQVGPESSAAWEKAAADFKKSFGDYFSIMGWVSKDEYPDHRRSKSGAQAKGRGTERDNLAPARPHQKSRHRSKQGRSKYCKI